MNVDMMKVFCNIVQQRSFSRGAAASAISQSAATQCVQRIEEFFGLPLIDRRTRPFVLTEAGQVCYDEFAKMVESYEALTDRLGSLHREISGSVRVAAIYSVGLHGMGQCMQEFMKCYPDAKVQLEFLRPPEVVEAVENGRVHLGIVSYPTTTPGLTVIPLRSEQMVLACHPDHPLADRDIVAVQDLRGERFIGFDRSLMIRKEIDRCFRQHSVSVQVVMEFDNIETIKQAVEIGAGVSILPEPTVCKEAQMGTLTAVRLCGCALRRPIGAIHRERMVFSPTLTRFVELLERMPVESLTEAS